MNGKIAIVTGGARDIGQQASIKLAAAGAKVCVNYNSNQQQADGSLRSTDMAEDPKAASVDPEGVNYYPGPALYGLMLSQRHRPAPGSTLVLAPGPTLGHRF